MQTAQRLGYLCNDPKVQRFAAVRSALTPITVMPALPVNTFGGVLPESLAGLF